MNTANLTRAFLVLVILAGGATAEGQAPAGKNAGRIVFDRWYALSLQGEQMGWMHERVRQQDDRITTSSQMKVALSRMLVSVNIQMASDFTETVDGKPIQAVSVQSLGAKQTIKTMRFGDDGIEMIWRQGDQERTSKLANPTASWEPPAAAGRRLAEEAADGRKLITIRRMDPAAGTTVVEERWQYQAEETVEVMGKVVPATKWLITSSLKPSMVTTCYLDAQGHMVRTTLKVLPGMGFEIVQADEQLAKAEITPPELLVSTLVRPNRRIARPRKLRSAIYELAFTAPGGADFSPQLPRGGSQRVVWGNNLTARVVIDLDEPVNPRDDLPTDAHRQATAMLNSDDPKIRELAADALGPIGRTMPVADRAETLRRFVHSYIDAKSLAVGFATAGEVARTRQGDCSEHAVLLAAMLRSANIPSRTVSGLLYVDQFADQQGVFGYHMWTQAWFGGDVDGGRWVDLDATLDKDTPFDATHIALVRSVLSDETMMNDMIDMAPMIGRLSVLVIDTSYDR